MKYGRTAIILFITTFIGFLVGTFLAQQKTVQMEYNNTLFTTVISADKESSIEEKETASHFFAEAVLGWTISPQFTNQLGFSISGKKQERGNIIFQFSSKTKEEGFTKSQEIQKNLNAKLNTYNIQAKTEFSFLFEPIFTNQKQFKQFSWGLLGAMLGFFGGLVSFEAVRLRSFFKKNNSL